MVCVKFFNKTRGGLKHLLPEWYTGKNILLGIFWLNKLKCVKHTRTFKNKFIDT
jgi:hypothetical protein